MKNRVIVYIIILLILPLILSVYLGQKSEIKNERKEDIVIYEANNSDKLDINHIDLKSAYTSVFIFVIIGFTIFGFVSNKKGA